MEDLGITVAEERVDRVGRKRGRSVVESEEIVKNNAQSLARSMSRIRDRSEFGLRNVKVGDRLICILSILTPC